ncbi:MAG: flagellar basal body-associated FliL family protein [Gammaproteobacteria bacterium]|nr:flagellar basal body-associated FliL family protein [Gammaproteobacteria bacterium]
MKSILALVLTLIISPVFAAAGGGGEKENAITTGKINYLLLEPNFVVNIHGKRGLRYMQAAIQIMTYDAATVTALQTHAAPIRHDLLMLLSDQKIETMQNAKERERIRHEALKIVQENLEKYAHISPNDTVKDLEEKSHPAGVQELYFTDLVIQ